MFEKYEAPAVDFVELNEKDIMTSSGTGMCTGGRGTIEVND